MNTKVGIMQGRILPESMDRYQVFPLTHWESELAKVSEIGFYSCEILFDKADCLETSLHGSDFKEKFFRSGRSLFKSACLDCLAEYSLASNPGPFIQKLNECLDALEQSSVRIVVVPFFDRNQIPEESALDQAFAHLKNSDIESRLESIGLRIALELTLPAAVTKALLEKYGFRRIGLCYDMGNAKHFDFHTADEIRLLGKHILHVHIKDRPVGGPNVRLGTGAVEFRETFRALQSIGYDGLMILETCYGPQPEQESRINLQFVKDTLQEALH